MDITHTTEARNRAAWRAWLEQHHADETEVWLIFYKKDSGQTSVGYEESVEEALCFGWIDGIRKSLDEQRYIQRFSPRIPGSAWSRSNRERAQRLAREGLMTPPGMALLPPDWAVDPALFERPNRLEQAGGELPAFIQAALDALPGLAEKFAALTPAVRRIYLGYILDAKREETRTKRLTIVLDHIERGEKIDFMKPLK
jgi:uncharacterized protein YdeI (YjbR/CyaY-like superfamily)